MVFRQKDQLDPSLYQPDDTIFRTDESGLMKLPGEPVDIYIEEQSINQIWVWALMGVEVTLFLVPMLLMKMSLSLMFIPMIILLFSLVALSSLRLRTRIDEEGVHYQMNLFQWKERTIPWSAIDQIYVRRYSPIREYGGWGIRWGLQGWAYSLRGSYGIQIVKKDGKRILVGTRQPEAAKQFLQKFPLLV